MTRSPIAQFGGNGVANALKRWQDAKKGERTSVYHLFPVDQYRQLAVLSVHQRCFNAQLLAQEGRRTGGLDPRDSIATAPNRHRHVSTSLKKTKKNCWVSAPMTAEPVNVATSP